MSTRPRRTTVALGALLGLMPFALSSAQQQVNFGHRLDANLQVGTGGYNRQVHRGSGGMNNVRYAFGSTRSPYVVSRSGNMVYSPHNAFNPTSRFAVTGYAGDYTGRRAYRSFRYER